MPLPEVGRKVHAPSVALDPWQADGSRRGYTILEPASPTRLSVGVFECEPGERGYTLEQNEVLHVLEGRATVVLDAGQVIELAPGDVAYLPSGQESRWTFHTRFKEIWILVD
jgi:uncharacterized cupin superfamily protein